MAVNRLWVPNAPSGGIGLAQKTQLAIGFSGIIITDILVTYYRRYLDDPSSVSSIGPPASIPVGTETNYTTYYRRYLNDLLAG